MQVLAINSSYRAQAFKAHEQQNYENPINRKTEKKLAVLSSVGGSFLAGTAAMGLATAIQAKPLNALKNWKLPALVGVAVAAIGLAVTLPAKLYNTKVGSFTREKEMDVFSRDRAAKSNILGAVNENISDENVPLEEKINNYVRVQMANSGSGMVIANA